MYETTVSVLSYTLLYPTVLYCTLLYSTLLYFTLLFSILLRMHCRTVLYCTVLYCIVQCRSVLYRTVLSYTITYHTILYFIPCLERYSQQRPGLPLHILRYATGSIPLYFPVITYTCHLYFLRIHTRLKARVYMENTSDASHIPRYPTRKHCITSIYPMP